MEKMINIELNDLVIFKNRIYKVTLKPWSNGENRGHRVQLILLREKELNEMLLKELKGGIKQNDD